ncbi:MAG: zinc ribbon domain-containing protein [Clostridiales bacterium]|nr:zinc ribbon domain-containing protein [Clostridiales bacterium]
MNLYKNTYINQSDDKLLKCAHIVSHALFGLECAFFLVFGIAGCVNVSMAFLIMVILGPVYSFLQWLLERMLIALYCDVKMMKRDRSSYAASPAATPAATDTTPPVENKKADDKETSFCPACGAQSIGGEKFCRKCGERLL